MSTQGRMTNQFRLSLPRLYQKVRTVNLDFNLFVATVPMEESLYCFNVKVWLQTTLMFQKLLINFVF